MKVRIYLPAALLLLAATARADELYLKDGSKIVGTIVGFEGNSFKVQTSYGFAVVEKDKILKIVTGSADTPKPEGKAEVKKEPAADTSKKPAAKVMETSAKPPVLPSKNEKTEVPPPDVSIRPDSKTTAVPAAVTVAPAPKPEPP